MIELIDPVQYIIFDKSTLEECLRKLDASALKFCIVCDSNGKFLGTVTDGDIRRSLLHHFDLNQPVYGVMNQRPISLRLEEYVDSLASKLMRSAGIKELPVIDINGAVAFIAVLNQNPIEGIKSESTMVIMAGGQGVRLRPYTESCPKPLLEVKGKPILQWIIENAKLQGIYKFIISINYLGEMIQNYFGDGSIHEVKIEYLSETIQLGTAGSLSLIKEQPKAPLIVVNGDVISNIKYMELLAHHSRNNAIATMAVQINQWKYPYGVVDVDGISIVGFEEKPVIKNYINSGIYVLDPLALNFLEKNMECDMPSLFETLRLNNKKTIIFPMHENWMDIGNEGDLKSAQLNL